MKIYLVRHAQSELNQTNFFQYTHTPLAPVGIKQAESLAQRFKTISIQGILTSPAQRAKQTAEIINQVAQTTLEESESLIEVRLPSELVGQDRAEEKIMKIQSLMRENINNPDFRYSDEETFFDTKERAIQVLKLLEERKEESLLVVSHSNFMRMLCAAMLFGEELEPATILKIAKFFAINNTGITVCEVEDSKWKLITWNDITHLG